MSRHPFSEAALFLPPPASFGFLSEEYSDDLQDAIATFGYGANYGEGIGSFSELDVWLDVPTGEVHNPRGEGMSRDEFWETASPLLIPDQRRVLGRAQRVFLFGAYGIVQPHTRMRDSSWHFDPRPLDSKRCWRTMFGDTLGSRFGTGLLSGDILIEFLQAEPYTRIDERDPDILDKVAERFVYEGILKAIDAQPLEVMGFDGRHFHTAQVNTSPRPLERTIGVATVSV